LAKRDISTYSKPEKFTAAILIVVILLFIAKFVYYDTTRFPESVKIGVAVALGIIAITLFILHPLRRLLFEIWVSWMIYMPIVIIIIIVIGVIIYFFQTISDSGGLGNA